MAIGTNNELTDLRGLRRLTQIKIREIREILLNP